ncbi:MAG: aryl-sulfate sulfotransferase [Bacteroidales bacterium]|nr:aryl-sulfate sulfotransferase [Bacteroidales bacterium]
MKYFVSILLFVVLFDNIHCQPTVGLLQQGVNDQPGYVLFAPIGYTKTYLIDKCGYEVHSWNSAYKPGNSVYFLTDGSLLRTGNTQNAAFSGGGKGGIIEKIAWNGNIIWSYLISDTQHLQHHEICPLPNGNFLVIAWEAKGIAAAISAGRNPNMLGTDFWGEKIMEIEYSGTLTANIVWEWHVWDHLVQEYDSTKSNYGSVSQHPELINFNYDNNGFNNPDWLHLNAVSYNPQRDEIILSSRFNNEIWIIDHSTTTAEAAGHTGGNRSKGGDLLFRWGNPAAYNKGNVSDQKFYSQHAAHWIEPGLKDAGSIMVFNNGTGRPNGQYSSVDIIKPVIDSNGNYLMGNNHTFLPDTLCWTYVAPVPEDFYSMNISGSQRLTNGNTLICSGATGLFFEIDSLKNIVWQYKCPVNGTGPVSQGSTIFINNVFKAPLYEASYPGFANHTISSGQPIELNPLPYICPTVTNIINNNTPSDLFNIFPNPGNGDISVNLKESMLITVYNALGEVIINERYHQGINLLNQLKNNSGVLFIKATTDNNSQQIKKIIIID